MRTALALAILLSAPTLAADAPAKAEPLFDRRPLSFWLAEFLGNGPFEKRSDRALAVLAPASVPELVALLQVPDEVLWNRIAGVLSVIGSDAGEHAPAARAAVAEGLGDPLRDEAAVKAWESLVVHPVLPEERLLRDDLVPLGDALRVRTKRGLHGTYAVPALLRRLGAETDVERRCLLVEMICELRPGSPEAHAASRVLASEKDWLKELLSHLGEFRAVNTLVRLGEPGFDDVVRAVREMGDGETWAMDVLVQSGTDALPAMRVLLADDDPRVSVRAIEAVGEHALPLPDELFALLRRTDAAIEKKPVGVKAAEALLKFGRHVDAAAQTLIAAWDPQDDDRFLEEMAEIRPAPVAALPPMWALLRHKDSTVRLGAVRACLHWGSTVGAVQTLTPLLRDPDAEVRVKAAHLLWCVTGRREPSLTVLKAALAIEETRDLSRRLLEVMVRDGEPYEVEPFAIVPAAGRRERVDPSVFVFELKAADPKRRFKAAGSLARAGLAARATVPALIDALRVETDNSVVAALTDALGEIGGPDAHRFLRWMVAFEEAFGPLYRMFGLEVGTGPADFSRPDEGVIYFGGSERSTAATALQGLIPPEQRWYQFRGSLLRPRRDLETLIRDLRNPDEYAGFEAACEIGDLGSAGATAVPEMARQIDRRGAVADGCIYALAKIGTPQAGEVLVATLRHRDPEISGSAADVLSRFRGPVPQGAVPLLKELARRRFGYWDAYMGTLIKLDRAAAIELLPVIIAQLDTFFAEVAARFLAELGPAAAPAADRVLELMDDSDDRLRFRAAEALIRIGVHRDKAIARMIEDVRLVLPPPGWQMLTREEDGVRSYRVWAALDCLQRCGPAAAPAVGELVRLLEGRAGRFIDQRDRQYWALEQFADVLGAIGPAAAAAVPVLTEFTGRRNHDVRLSAARALWRITGKADPAVGVLVDLARGRGYERPYGFIRFDPEERKAEVRRTAGALLAEIGDPRGVAAVTELLEFNEWFGSHVFGGFTRGRQVIRQAAAQALARFGPAAAPAVPALIERLEDPSCEVRRAVADALGKIGPKAAAALPALERAGREDFDLVFRGKTVEAARRIHGR